MRTLHGLTDVYLTLRCQKVSIGASVVLPARASPLYVNVAVVDGGQFELHKVTVDPWTPVRYMHNRIRDALIQDSTLGELFRSSLDILPLPKTPTFSELQGRTLDDLHLKACRKVMDLPHEELAKFFNLFAEKTDPLEEHIHFIVWLPPDHRKFLYHHTSSI